MAAKETIALVGMADGPYTDLIPILARENYRFLLVSDDAGALEQLCRQVIQDIPGAEIETIDCVKNGCWEADIIVLGGTGSYEEELLDRIRIFTTQKIVVGISVIRDKSAVFEARNIQRLLPDSKVVHVFVTSASGEAFIAGDDLEAVEAIDDLAVRLGYHPIRVDSFQTSRNLN